MPKIHDMLESKFLKKEDVGAGALMTVLACIQKNVAKQGADPEMKWCLTFREDEKPLVLNSTNIQLCQQIFGSDDTDHWIGKPIVLYTDPNVSYQGKIVGGIRVRKPRLKPATAAPVATPPPPPVASEFVRVPGEDDGPLGVDEIPFAWLMPFIVPAVGLLGMGLLFA